MTWNDVRVYYNFRRAFLIAICLSYSLVKNAYHTHTGYSHSKLIMSNSTQMCDCLVMY